MLDRNKCIEGAYMEWTYTSTNNKLLFHVTILKHHEFKYH